MQFIPDTLNLVLAAIENNMKFPDGDITQATTWNAQIELKVQDLINENSDKAESIMYVIRTLELLHYITFNKLNHSIIDGITEKGLSLIFEKLHNIKI